MCEVSFKIPKNEGLRKFISPASSVPSNSVCEEICSLLLERVSGLEWSWLLRGNSVPSQSCVECTSRRIQQRRLPSTRVVRFSCQGRRGEDGCKVAVRNVWVEAAGPNGFPGRLVHHSFLRFHISRERKQSVWGREEESFAVSQQLDRCCLPKPCYQTNSAVSARTTSGCFFRSFLKKMLPLERAGKCCLWARVLPITPEKSACCRGKGVARTGG